MLPFLHQSYWRDEAYAVLLSQKPLSEMFSLTVIDTHPPLFFFILHYWMRLFGDAEHITRSLTLIFHFLLVLSSFALINYFVKNWKVALAGAAAVLLNPFLINYAFEVKGYSLFAFLVVTSAYFYISKRPILFSIFISLAALTHNFGAFFLAAFALHWAYVYRSELINNLTAGLKYFLIPGVVIMSWLAVLWDEWGKVSEGFWIEPVSTHTFLNAFRTYFQGNVDYSSKAMLYILTLILIFFALSYWVVKSVKTDLKTEFKNKVLVFAFVCAIPFFSVFTISAFWVPVFHERYLIPILPLMIVFITISLYKLASLKNSISYLIFAFALSYLLFAFQSAGEILQTTTKPPINYAVSQILSNAEEGDVIIPESNLNFLESKHYVQAAEKDIPVYAYSPTGEVAFYIGAVLFEEGEIITEYPDDKRVWVVESNGGFHLREQ